MGQTIYSSPSIVSTTPLLCDALCCIVCLSAGAPPNSTEWWSSSQLVLDDSREFIDSPLTWKSAANENDGRTSRWKYRNTHGKGSVTQMEMISWKLFFHIDIGIVINIPIRFFNRHSRSPFSSWKRLKTKLICQSIDHLIATTIDRRMEP